jgi:hypothetical protein
VRTPRSAKTPPSPCFRENIDLGEGGFQISWKSGEQKLLKNRHFHENRMKEVLSRFGSARNRFLASNYPYIRQIEKIFVGD